jgi:predicted TIM-barrel fold metal-dependent hydrolase
MIVDFHVHCFPEELAARATAALSERSGVRPFTDGTVGGIKASMGEAGIDRSVVLSIATRPQQASKITRWAASVQDDAVVAFGSIHPDSPAWREELGAIRDAGLMGIKLHPDYQEFFVDEERLFPIYERALELGLIIIFHAGVDIGLPPPYHCTPDRLRRAVRAFPGGKFVAAHMGGFKCWDEVESCLVGENVYLDTSFSLQWMEPERFLRILREHGHEKVLFATDSPWGGQKEELERIRSLGLTPGEECAVLGGNAAKLLGLTCQGI